MQAVYHVEYRDLPLPKLATFVRHLPGDSAIAAIGRDGPYWSLESQLLDDVRIRLELLLGAPAKDVQPHPQRPKPLKHVDPERQKKRNAAKQRLRERERAIAAGEIT